MLFLNTGLQPGVGDSGDKTVSTISPTRKPLKRLMLSHRFSTRLKPGVKETNKRLLHFAGITRHSLHLNSG